MTASGGAPSLLTNTIASSAKAKPGSISYSPNHPSPPVASLSAPVAATPVVSNTVVVTEASEQPVIANARIDDSAGDPIVGSSPQLLILRAVHSPPPAYPRRELARGISAQVELRVLVGINGLPQRIEVIGGSGNRAFKLAAIRAVKRWRFAPHSVDGQARSAWARVPLNFRIEN